MSIILSSAYHAPIQYYTKFLCNTPVIIEQNETYIKQSYRNRCLINTADGAMPLSVPVVFSASERTKMKDVGISEHDNWQHTHWNAIVSAYNSSPFFEYYRDDYEKFYTSKFDNLLDFNNELLRLTLSLLKIDIPEIRYSENYIDHLSDDDLDYRELIHPKKGWQMDSSFYPTPYYQTFGDKNGFIPNLSILDLLFNMGNESLLVLLSSIKE